ncbi:hypothetical protein OSSY52_17700 [Tepiditoga spiralis]|uniref:Uncharacterized protein n=1 Tax=Tepiditoga spiralis TaxID=2108365 RepID=A0A7G1GC22_9BACT|nr:hypothetical protein [Tepiditoga spiralis]BBE31629.1 hypothetical protein OSSY52_17700 [Tepiditoga spiralis]
MTNNKKIMDKFFSYLILIMIVLSFQRKFYYFEDLFYINGINLFFLAFIVFIYSSTIISMIKEYKNKNFIRSILLVPFEKFTSLYFSIIITDIFFGKMFVIRNLRWAFEASIEFFTFKNISIPFFYTQIFQLTVTAIIFDILYKIIHKLLLNLFIQEKVDNYSIQNEKETLLKDVTKEVYDEKLYKINLLKEKVVFGELYKKINNSVNEIINNNDMTLTQKFNKLDYIENFIKDYLKDVNKYEFNISKKEQIRKKFLKKYKF